MILNLFFRNDYFDPSCNRILKVASGVGSCLKLQPDKSHPKGITNIHMNIVGKYNCTVLQHSITTQKPVPIGVAVRRIAGFP